MFKKLLRTTQKNVEDCIAKAATPAPEKSVGFQFTKTKCGIKVGSAENNLPISHVGIGFRAGSRFETSMNLGVTHLMRVASGMKTAASTGFALYRCLQHNGGRWSAISDREFIFYLISVTRDKTDIAFKTLCQGIVGMLFRPWEIADAKKMMIEDVYRIPPRIQTMELLHQAAFHSGLSNSIFCPLHRLQTYDHTDLCAFYGNLFTPTNAAVAAVGVCHDELVSFADGLKLVANKKFSLEQYEVSQYRGSEKRLECPDRNSLVHFAVSFNGSALHNLEQSFAASVIAHCWGVMNTIKNHTHAGQSKGMLAKKLHSSLNDEWFQCNAFNLSYIDNGLLGCLVSTTKTAGKPALLATTELMLQTVISQEEFILGKTKLMTNILFNLEKGSNVCQELMGQMLNCGTIQNLPDILNIIESIDYEFFTGYLKDVILTPISLASFGDISRLPYLDEIQKPKTV